MDGEGADISAHEIIKLRQHLRLTQEEFARELGVALSTVSRWENGRSRPSGLATARLAEIRDRQPIIKRE